MIWITVIFLAITTVCLLFVLAVVYQGYKIINQSLDQLHIEVNSLTMHLKSSLDAIEKAKV